MNPAVNEGEVFDECVAENTSAIQEAIAATAPMRRLCADPRPPILASIPHEIHLKNLLRPHWQVTRDPAQKALVNRFKRSATYRLNEWRNDQWSETLESLDSEVQSLWKMTKEWCEF